MPRRPSRRPRQRPLRRSPRRHIPRHAAGLRPKRELQRRGGTGPDGDSSVRPDRSPGSGKCRSPKRNGHSSAKVSYPILQDISTWEYRRDCSTLATTDGAGPGRWGGGLQGGDVLRSIVRAEARRRERRARGTSRKFLGSQAPKFPSDCEHILDSRRVICSEYNNHDRRGYYRAKAETSAASQPILGIGHHPPSPQDQRHRRVFGYRDPGASPSAFRDAHGSGNFPNSAFGRARFWRYSSRLRTSQNTTVGCEQLFSLDKFSCIKSG